MCVYVVSACGCIHGVCCMCLVCACDVCMCGVVGHVLVSMYAMVMFIT